jgi:hypothetical protein
MLILGVLIFISGCALSLFSTTFPIISQYISGYQQKYQTTSILELPDYRIEQFRQSGEFVRIAFNA